MLSFYTNLRENSLVLRIAHYREHCKLSQMCKSFFFLFFFNFFMVWLMCASLGDGSFWRKPRDEEMDREIERWGRGLYSPGEGTLIRTCRLVLWWVTDCLSNCISLSFQCGQILTAHPTSHLHYNKEREKVFTSYLVVHSSQFTNTESLTPPLIQKLKFSIHFPPNLLLSSPLSFPPSFPLFHLLHFPVKTLDFKSRVLFLFLCFQAVIPELLGCSLRLL